MIVVLASVGHSLDFVLHNNIACFDGPWELGQAEAADTQQVGIPVHLRALSMEGAQLSCLVVYVRTLRVVSLMLLKFGFS